MSEQAAVRRANFFKGTLRDPEAGNAPDAAVADALIVVAANIDAQTKADGRELTTVQRERSKSVAQRLLRALPRDQLQNIASHGGLLKSITDQSLAVAPVTDVRTASSAETRFAHGDGTGTGEPVNALSARRGADGGERGASSFARLAEMGRDRSSPELAVMMQAAASEAVRLGIPWAATRPELLRLGTAAVRAIADVNLKEQSYQRLRTDGRFEVRDVLTFATYAKSKGIKDANQAAGAVADFVQLGQDPVEQQRLRDAVVGFMKASNEAGVAPHDPAAQQRLQQAGAQYRETARDVAKRSPEAADATRRMEDANRVPQIFRATAAKDELKADAREPVADDLYAAAATPAPPKALPPNNGDAGLVAPNRKDGVKAVEAAAIAPKVTAPKV